MCVSAYDMTLSQGLNFEKRLFHGTFATVSFGFFVSAIIRWKIMVNAMQRFNSCWLLRVQPFSFWPKIFTTATVHESCASKGKRNYKIWPQFLDRQYGLLLLAEWQARGHGGVCGETSTELHGQLNGSMFSYRLNKDALGLTGEQ